MVIAVVLKNYYIYRISRPRKFCLAAKLIIINANVSLNCKTHTCRKTLFTCVLFIISLKMRVRFADIKTLITSVIGFRLIGVLQSAFSATWSCVIDCKTINLVSLAKSAFNCHVIAVEYFLIVIRCSFLRILSFILCAFGVLLSLLYFDWWDISIYRLFGRFKWL